MISCNNIIYDIIYTYGMMMLVISYAISYHDIPGGPPPPSPPPASAAASLRRFLVSAALILLSLRRSALILSASAMDTIRARLLKSKPACY
jgi:hypothetical protein